MKQFFALVHKDDDSAFGIRFPDVPGCFSAADSFDDVLPNAVEALSLWFEDTAPTAPRRLEEIRAEVTAEIAEGAFLLAVPLIVPENATVRANLSFDRGVLRAIDMAAEQLGLSRSGFLAEAARNEIEGRH